MQTLGKILDANYNKPNIDEEVVTMTLDGISMSITLGTSQTQRRSF